ncbi:TadE/TadG family type IV pilus assembly protein [Massilia aurea]|uniref:pilus assembly protein TadG-related protein n=1 Tax=Massilia aurea TaxID=373040 RepID=UPI003463195A
MVSPSNASPQGLHRQDEARRGHQRGVISVMFVIALVIICGFLALAVDLSLVIHRKTELQNIADTIALSAAHDLDGTATGITKALATASSRFPVHNDRFTYSYGKKTMAWSDTAMQFASSPSGPWRSAGEAATSVDDLLYVQFDTAGLDSDYGSVATLFLRTFTDTADTFTSARAIAGRSGLRVTPLGICAMGDESHRNHNGELEEFGFRRGVGYNLLDLNRPGAATGQTYIVNPVAQATAITDVASLAPFVCTGTIAMSRLSGGAVRVSPSFPIDLLYQQLNSRFGTYGTNATACDARTAPSDVNTKEYTFNGGSVWMGAAPAQQSAALLQTPERRWTVAGPDAAPAGTLAVQFGPLWSYARAVPYASYTSLGTPEPAAGYPTYDTTAWGTLYTPGQPTTSASKPYPTSATTPTPYSQTSGPDFFKAAPANNKSFPNRRVLHLPLLACPVSGSQATVRGIGKFFMTVQAKSNALYGEFAGLAREQSLGTRIVLYP